MGLTANEAVNFEAALFNSGLDSKRNIALIMRQTDEINKQTNMGLRYNNVIKQISEASEGTLAVYKGQTAKLTNVIKLAAKYGRQ